MIVSDTHKFVFIHIPKTAGISVRKTLEPYATVPIFKRAVPHLVKRPKQKNPLLFQHATAKNINRLVLKDRWNGYFTFCFIRNPWDWMVSWYLFWKTKSKAGGDICVRAKRLTFNDYVTWYHSTKPQPARNRIRLGFSEFTHDDSKKKLIKFVGRFERFEEDFSTICSTLGIPCKVFKLNTTKRNKPYRKFYNEQSIQLVTSIFKNDIKEYGYSF